MSQNTHSSAEYCTTALLSDAVVYSSADYCTAVNYSQKCSIAVVQQYSSAGPEDKTLLPGIGSSGGGVVYTTANRPGVGRLLLLIT